MKKHECWDDIEEPPDAGKGRLEESTSPKEAATEFGSDRLFAGLVGDVTRVAVRELGASEIMLFEVRRELTYSARRVPRIE